MRILHSYLSGNSSSKSSLHAKRVLTKREGIKLGQQYQIPAVIYLRSLTSSKTIASESALAFIPFMKYILSCSFPTCNNLSGHVIFLTFHCSVLKKKKLCSVDGPRSIKEFNSKITALAESGNSGELKNSGELNIESYNETDDPLHIHGDAGDLLPRSNAEYLVLEIVEGSKHSVGLVARAMSQPMGTTEEKSPDEPKAIQIEGSGKPRAEQSSLDEPKAAGSEHLAPDISKKRGDSEAREADASSLEEDTEMTEATGITNDAEGFEDEDNDNSIVVGLEEAEEEAKASKKIWNATSRRRGAFRRGLVRCVMLLHEAHLKRLGPDFQDYDPLREGQWHAGFPVATLTLADILKAAEEAAEQLANAEQSGRVK